MVFVSRESVQKIFAARRPATMLDALSLLAPASRPSRKIGFTVQSLSQVFLMSIDKAVSKVLTKGSYDSARAPKRDFKGSTRAGIDFGLAASPEVGYLGVGEA